MNSGFNSPPQKGIWPVLAAIFLVMTLALGVLYFLEIRSSNKLKSELESASSASPSTTTTEPVTETATTADTSTLDKLNAQIKTLTAAKTAAETAKTTAETAKTTAETAKTAADAAKATAENSLAVATSDKAIALKYNDVLAYIVDVVDAHAGFDGITIAEFNAVKALAEKTGDAGLTTKLDWAWTEVAVSSITRLTGVLDYIQGKISTNLQ